MFSRMIKIIGVDVLVIGAALLFAAGWLYWSIGAIETMKQMSIENDNMTQEIQTLRGNIKDYLIQLNDLDKGFSDLEQSQVDLLCSARYQQPLIKTEPALPLVKEIVVYRDRMSKCPVMATDDTPINPMGTTLQPVNEEIAVQVLDNTWKAYCLAVKNEDPVCQPSK